jgi:short-subunit dehydrogenase
MSEQPRALITGASAGIGEGFARHLASDGYSLVLVARRRERLEALAGSLAKEHGITADIVAADLASEDGVSAVEQRLRGSDIELVVNNAGFGTVGAFGELPLERELEEVDVNIRALVRLSHVALEEMVPRRSGGIINLGSMAAYQPIPYNSTYAASKAFVLHFSQGLHEEAKPHGVTVTCVCPGPVKTEFQDVAGIDGSRIPAMNWVSVDDVVERALAGWRSGAAVVIPGAANVMTAVGAKLAPHALSRRIAGAMFRSQVRH